MWTAEIIACDVTLVCSGGGLDFSDGVTTQLSRWRPLLVHWLYRLTVVQTDIKLHYFVTVASSFSNCIHTQADLTVSILLVLFCFHLQSLCTYYETHFTKKVK